MMLGRPCPKGHGSACIRSTEGTCIWCQQPLDWDVHNPPPGAREWLARALEAFAAAERKRRQAGLSDPDLRIGRFVGFIEGLARMQLADVVLRGEPPET